MSTLELNGRVFDASTTGTLTLTSEGGAATTDVTQGLAKAWVNLDGTSSGAAARDSFNVASTTDTGTGNYKQTFTNNMSNDDYNFGLYDPIVNSLKEELIKKRRIKEIKI